MRKDPEDSKCLDLYFINLNNKKIYNKLTWTWTKSKPGPPGFGFVNTLKKPKGETSVLNSKTCEEVCCRSFCHSSLPYIIIYYIQ